MSNMKLEGKKGAQIINVDPSTLLIWGEDKNHDPNHWLHDGDRLEEPLDDAMVQNIMRLGILQAVEAVEIDSDPIVVFGRRRVRHAREANRILAGEGKPQITVPVVMLDRKTAQSTMLDRLIAENELRRPTSPLQKSIRLQQWFEINPNATDEDAAVIFGATSTAIRNWKRAWKLAPELKMGVIRDEISFTNAVEMADLDPAEQAEKFMSLKKSAEESGRVVGTDAPAPVSSAPQATSRRVVTGNAVRQERRARTGSTAAVAYEAPPSPVLRKIVADENLSKALDPVVVKVLRYVVGLDDGSDFPELVKFVKATPSRGNAVGPQLKPAEAKILADIDKAPDRKIPESSTKKGALEGLIKSGLAERKTGPDGVVYVSRVVRSGDGESASETLPAEPGESSGEASEPSSEPSGETSGETPEASGEAPEASGETESEPDADSAPAPEDESKRRPSVPPRNDLEDMKPAELIALGKKLGIQGIEKMSAAKRVEAILAMDTNFSARLNEPDAEPAPARGRKKKGAAA